MRVFNAHVPAGQLTASEKRWPAVGLNLALHEALGTPMEDRFIVITVTLGAGCTVEKKRRRPSS